MSEIMNIPQLEHEIEWLKRKLETIPLSRLKYRKDILRQIKERELWITFLNKTI